MNNKIIFKLEINEKDSIIAYEKNNYKTCYEDAILYLKNNNKYFKIVDSSYKVLLINLLEDKQTHQYKANIIYEYELLKNQFIKWKSIIKEEWESRAIIEGERISGQMPRYEWEKYFLSMRTKNKVF